MNVLFIGDLHFGHKRITEFTDPLRPDEKFRTGADYKENMQHIMTNWNNKVTKRDLVYVIGDVAFSEEGFDNLKLLKGRKILVRGNHDNYFNTQKWLEVFDDVEGIVRYKNYWLSHCPIHPDELRGKSNIHGHVHFNSIKDPLTGEYDERYINVSCEAVNETPLSLHELRNGDYQRNRRC